MALNKNWFSARFRSMHLSYLPIILSFREGSAERAPPVGLLHRALSSQRLEVLETAAARATSWSEGVDRIGRGGGGRKRTSDGGRGALLQGEYT